MATPDELVARLEGIEAAIASGTTRVTVEGVGSTDFRSLADLYRVRDELRRDLGITASSRRSVASFNSGLG
jgi:sirohydrochlorin ferrochelatase